jgi:PAS domain S-box-containing protein
MKSFILKRIIILMTIAIIISSIAIVLLGVVLSEELVVSIRGDEFIPDLSVLSQCAKEYQNGNISREVFERIVTDASKGNVKQYVIYDENKSVAFATEGTDESKVDEKLNELTNEVLGGESVSYDIQLFSREPLEIVGIPIREGERIVGAVFVVSDVVNLTEVRNKYLLSHVRSIIIVIPFVVGLSYLVIKRIIRPIKNITQVAISMTDGDFSIRADETLKGELGFIGRTMNELSVNLYKNISQLFVEKNRLHQVLNSLDEGMIAVDENRKITHFNNVLSEKFDLTHEMIVGLDIHDIEYLSGELDELDHAISGDFPIIKTAILGESILEIIIAPIENEIKQNAGAVILFRDITEMVKLENMRKDYVANVSHELRSPLTSIRGLIEPLMDSVVKDEEDIKRYYQIIYRESLRLSRLVDDIMELSRLQTNEAVINKTDVDLSLVLDMVYERYKLLDESIKLVYTPKALPTVFSNYDRIEQILVILLDNAYKFTQENGQIEIETELREKDILIKVKDTGVGITKEDLPFVFQRFYKSDKSRTRKGTGLGLSIAKEILTIMGETISVHSVKDVGSEFSFTIHKKS